MSEVSLFGQSWFGYSYCGEVFGCNVAVKTVGESSIFSVMSYVYNNYSHNLNM